MAQAFFMEPTGQIPLIHAVKTIIVKKKYMVCLCMDEPNANMVVKALNAYVKDK